MPVLLIYFFGWFFLMILGILNGAFREAVFAKHFKEITAHQLSCLTGLVFFGIAVYTMNQLWPITSLNQAWLIGSIWLAMTILFEFGFGHFIMKHPWKRLFHDYRIDKGRLWVLVLLCVLILPLFVFIVS